MCDTCRKELDALIKARHGRPTKAEVCELARLRQERVRMQALRQGSTVSPELLQGEGKHA